MRKKRNDTYVSRGYEQGLMRGIEIGFREATDSVFRVTDDYVRKIENAPVQQHMIIGIPAVGPEHMDSNFLNFIKEKYSGRED